MKLEIGDKVKVTQIIAKATQDKSWLIDLLQHRLGDIGIISQLGKGSDPCYFVDFGGGDEDSFNRNELTLISNEEWQAAIQIEQEQDVYREYDEITMGRAL